LTTPVGRDHHPSVPEPHPSRIDPDLPDDHALRDRDERAVDLSVRQRACDLVCCSHWMHLEHRPPAVTWRRFRFAAPCAGVAIATHLQVTVSASEHDRTVDNVVVKYQKNGGHYRLAALGYVGPAVRRLGHAPT
jgi:hypothetical protein